MMMMMMMMMMMTAPLPADSTLAAGRQAPSRRWGAFLPTLIPDPLTPILILLSSFRCLTPKFRIQSFQFEDNNCPISPLLKNDSSSGFLIFPSKILMLQNLKSERLRFKNLTGVSLTQCNLWETEKSVGFFFSQRKYYEIRIDGKRNLHAR